MGFYIATPTAQRGTGRSDSVHCLVGVFLHYHRVVKRKGLLWPFLLVANRWFGGNKYQFLTVFYPQNIGFSERCHSHSPVAPWAPESCRGLVIKSLSILL